MRRSSERLIDVVVLFMLLAFAWLMREPQPGLAGVIVAASIQFWMAKNATEATTADKIAEAAASAAASALLRAERRDVKRDAAPSEVEIVGQSDAVEVDVVEKRPRP